MKHKTGSDKNSSPVNRSENNEEPASSQTVEDLHREMNEWRSEHSAWLEDINEWQREHKLAELVLYKLDRALPNHTSALANHTEAINQHKKRVNTYERSLKHFIVSSKQDNVQYQTLIKEHRAQEARHLSERQRHKSFRDTHLATMAELIRLSKLIDSSE